MNRNNSRKNTILPLWKKVISYIKIIAPFIGFFILIYMIINIGVIKIAETFLKISIFDIIIVIVLTFPRLIIRNIQWQTILKKQHIHINFLHSLKIFLIGYFYGSITPGYLGISMRIPYLKEATNQPFGKIFINSIIETAVHGLSLYIMMLIGSFLLIEQYPQLFIGGCIFVTVNLSIYLFFIKKERGEKTLYFVIRFLIPKRFSRTLEKFVNTFYNDFPRVRDYIVPFLLGIPAWVIIYTQIYIIGLSIGINLPYFLFLVLFPIANIIAFIPISSAGLGTREAILVFLFSFFGIAPEKTLVVSLAGYLLTDVLTGIYGFILSLTETTIKDNNITIFLED